MNYGAILEFDSHRLILELHQKTETQQKRKLSVAGRRLKTPYTSRARSGPASSHRKDDRSFEDSCWTHDRRRNDRPCGRRGCAIGPHLSGRFVWVTAATCANVRVSKREIMPRVCISWSLSDESEVLALYSGPLVRRKGTIGLTTTGIVRARTERASSLQHNFLTDVSRCFPPLHVSRKHPTT